MQVRSALLPLVLIIGCGLASAHQDTPIALRDGNLVGLPKVFQPAKFDRQKKILTIGDKELQLPPVLERLFPDAREEDLFGAPHHVEGIPYALTFSASWYHGPSMLPPYLQIGITPKDRDFRFEILLDIQNVEVLKAEMIVSLSPNSYQFIPIQFDEPAEAAFDQDWRTVLGKWKSGSTVVSISSDAIEVTDRGGAVDYPTGSISINGPGAISLLLPDGVEERIRFIREGDILNLYLERGGFELVRVGSETDKLYERLRNEAEQDGAGEPATRAESDSEGGDKPQPESEERSQ